jgi:hypothetical protein
MKCIIYLGEGGGRTKLKKKTKNTPLAVNTLELSGKEITPNL